MARGDGGRMKVSLTISSPGPKTAPILFRGDYAERIAEAAAIGYRAVELHIRDPKTVDRFSIQRSVERTGVTVSTIGTGQAYGEDRIFFSSIDKEVRRAAVQRIKDQIDFASELGAKVIIGLIRGPLPELEQERAVARSRVIDCLKECADYAQKGNVQLPLEAINRYENNFLNTAEETDRFLRETGSSLLGLHLDTFHMNIEEVSIEAAIRKQAKGLIHMHLADSNRWTPGMGHLDFRSILSTLRDIGYHGYLGLECLPRPDAETAAAQALRYLEEILSEIM
ncbi:MAG: sugar phosphate isomerase/epimerase [Deltaproteobacteria bacterium]|nr:MAG: sugar phosphate isomerase/epimerase [Deltaproteobacteria bacterium]